MTRKLGWILMTLAMTLSASAAVNPGTISGSVRNSTGTPQMGASVEILAQAASHGPIVYTDAKGRYTAHGLLPGTYTVRVSAPSFLPSIREHVGLLAGANLVVNVTLNTLFEAIQFVPRKANSPEEQDDWRWTLRSVANRPILRLASDGPLVVVRNKDEETDAVLKAKVAFMAGSNGEAFSGSDMSTNFEYEQSVFGHNEIAFNGNVGYGNGTPAMFRARYTHKLPNGTNPEVTLTAKRFASPDMVARHAALQALALTVSNTTPLTNSIEFNYGAEAQAVQFIRTATAFRPFGSLDWHLGDNTVVEYKYASSAPNMRREKGFETAPSDLSESTPRLSLMNGDPTIERARHHEVSVSRRQGKNNFQLAAFHDRITNTALTGVGAGLDSEGDILGDVYSGTFLYNGGSMATNGLRGVYERKLTDSTSATFDYSYGGVLTAPDKMMTLSDVRNNLRVQRRHSLAAKFSGTLPATHTKVLTSYRWTSGDALTSVDMFNSSPGESDPALSLFIRQPLPNRKFIPAGMEALVDVRNLLAQGYRPVLSTDGQTLYLVQVARSIRGGLSYTF
jgi:Carboxypeptidase regulatory-like domain